MRPVVYVMVSSLGLERMPSYRILGMLSTCRDCVQRTDCMWDLPVHYMTLQGQQEVVTCTLGDGLSAKPRHVTSFRYPVTGSVYEPFVTCRNLIFNPVVQTMPIQLAAGDNCLKTPIKKSFCLLLRFWHVGPTYVNESLECQLIWSKRAQTKFKHVVNQDCSHYNPLINSAGGQFILLEHQRGTRLTINCHAVQMNTFTLNE